MFFKGEAEVVTSVILRDKIEGFFISRIKSCLKRSSSRVADRSWRKAAVEISVVRRFKF
jgi:hypothetical protein